MPANPVAENVLGTIGTICWTIQLVPQIWKSWRSKSTEGLSEWLMLLWGFSGTTFGVYAIVQDLNVPLIVQPQLLAALSYMSWAQCQYYGRKRAKVVSIVLYIVICVVSAGFEAGMVFAVKPSYDHGNVRGVQFFGAISTVLLSVALLPQYYEIYKHKEVIGISILFMLVDMMGGVFSDLSLAFKAQFDVVAGVTYSLVVVLDGIVVLCAIILNPRAARRRKRMEGAANRVEVTQEQEAVQEGPPADAAQKEPQPVREDTERPGRSGERTDSGAHDANAIDIEKKEAR